MTHFQRIRQTTSKMSTKYHRSTNATFLIIHENICSDFFIYMWWQFICEKNIIYFHIYLLDILNNLLRYIMLTQLCAFVPGVCFVPSLRVFFGFVPDPQHWRSGQRLTLLVTVRTSHLDVSGTTYSFYQPKKNKMLLSDCDVCEKHICRALQESTGPQDVTKKSEFRKRNAMDIWYARKKSLINIFWLHLIRIEIGTCCQHLSWRVSPVSHLCSSW